MRNCFASGVSMYLLDCETFRLTLTEKVTKVAVSLTGGRVYFVVKQSLDPSQTVLIEKDSDVGPTEIEIVAAPDDNQALIKLVESDTVGMTDGNYCYAIKVWLATGECRTVLSGSFCLRDGTGETA